jgi:hypothetical protein
LLREARAKASDAIRCNRRKERQGDFAARENRPAAAAAATATATERARESKPRARCLVDARSLSSNAHSPILPSEHSAERVRTRATNRRVLARHTGGRCCCRVLRRARAPPIARPPPPLPPAAPWSSLRARYTWPLCRNASRHHAARKGGGGKAQRGPRVMLMSSVDRSIARDPPLFPRACVGSSRNTWIGWRRPSCTTSLFPAHTRTHTQAALLPLSQPPPPPPPSSLPSKTQQRRARASRSKTDSDRQQQPTPKP